MEWKDIYSDNINSKPYKWNGDKLSPVETSGGSVILSEKASDYLLLEKVEEIENKE